MVINEGGGIETPSVSKYINFTPLDSRHLNLRCGMIGLSICKVCSDKKDFFFMYKPKIKVKFCGQKRLSWINFSLVCNFG